MKHLENTKENRIRYCKQQIDLLNKELENPDNFVKNKYAEQAEKDLEIKGDDSNGN